MKNGQTAINRKKLIRRMDNDSAALFYSGTLYALSADMNYPFEADRDFYYFTGTEEPDFIFMAEKTADYTKETLFAYRKDELEEKWTGRRLCENELAEISGIENIVSADKFFDYFAAAMSRRNFKTVYINTQIVSSWKKYKTPCEHLAQSVREKYPHVNIKNAREITAPIRAIKEGYETDNIKKAVSVTDRAVQRMILSSYPGMNEKELQAEFEYEVIKAGMKNSFAPIIASGENALVLHYDKNNNIIAKDSLVLIDVGARCENYCADVSRTFPISGKFSPAQKQVYEIVLRANEEVIKFIKDGVTFSQAEDVAKRTLAQGLRQMGITVKQEDLSNYYYHTIGHSLGLDAHDVCDKSLPIKSGMVITVEPGLYIKELNIGVRIEDDVLVTDFGCEVLTSEIIKKTEDIESFMQSRKKGCNE
jgi:Xaa-Pro aminopeptidase